MKWDRALALSLPLLSCLIAVSALADDAAVELPPGVAAQWDLSKALHETTPTRQRICINGLWRWQPAYNPNAPPADRWGYFKVPGCWPGITDYMQMDCQTVFAHPVWRSEKLRDITSAWYQREILAPADWSGRRIILHLEYLNSLATIFLDGAKVGEATFPAADVDLTSAIKPGTKQILSNYVAAVPLQGVILAYTDSAHARTIKGTVERRGLCGDVFLVGEPAAERIKDVKVRTSVRNWEISFDAGLTELKNDRHYTLSARVFDGNNQVGEFVSKPFAKPDVTDGRFVFSASWKAPKLWDLNTPANLYRVEVTLVGENARPLDSYWPQTFGFREFWIDGRDFYLNGTRIYLSSVPINSGSVGAAWASYDGAKETLRRLKAIGINYVYGHNYDCRPGSHLSFEEILRAADDVGMLVGLTQPHFSDYQWKAADADQNNGYARHAAFYVDVAGNHPSVIAYPMSHNATGYEEDMDPDLIGGVSAPRENWSANNVKLAQGAAAIVQKLDPGRLVYHHASGNLGPIHDMNYYANFSPIQEQSDWFGEWSQHGVKPAFTCEYGVPFTWDWTMYRGWYKGKREFGSAAVPWEFCVAEWDSQFTGDAAFRVSEVEKTDLRWEAKQFRAGNVWHRWDYPADVGSTRFEERFPIMAAYTTDNWRAFRTWGVSGISPWLYSEFWKLRDGIQRHREALPVDWDNLQRPGYSPDFIDEQPKAMDLAYKAGDWIVTPAAAALIRNNGPLLAFIGGPVEQFTSKNANFRAGETVQKSLIVINNSRQTVACHCKWTLALSPAIEGQKEFSLPTGQQERIPLTFDLPARLKDGAYELTANVHFDTGEDQSDSFSIRVVSASRTPHLAAKIAIFDPVGETTKLLKTMGIAGREIDASADLADVDLLVIGKKAMTVDGACPNIERVRNGLNVIIFEQTPEVLEKRLGFRVAQYGLRQVFRRVPDHAILSGMSDADLSNWRGESTILAPRLQYERRPMLGPTIEWAGIRLPQIWRCGNRGDVASSLIEKPACGDFLPIINGGYSLQYSPLLEFREGRGKVIFCQMDVTGRSEEEPAAQILAANLIDYAAAKEPKPIRKALYAGNAAGLAHLKSIGVDARPYEGDKLTADDVLILAHGYDSKLGAARQIVADWLNGGGHLVAIGLDESEANSLLPFKVQMRSAEHISCYFDPPPDGSPFAGVGPADAHNRDPRNLLLITDGATLIGDGVFAFHEHPDVVFCQTPPWEFQSTQVNIKRTWRRTSFALTRILANAGVQFETPILDRFSKPLDPGEHELRCLSGLYIDKPEAWDYPYRFFRW